MDSKLKTEAKQLAKAYSLNMEYRDVAIYIIYNKRTAQFYVDNLDLIRSWEQLVGYYINGVYTAEKTNS